MAAIKIYPLPREELEVLFAFFLSCKYYYELSSANRHAVQVAIYHKMVCTSNADDEPEKLLKGTSVSVFDIQSAAYVKLDRLLAIAVKKRKATFLDKIADSVRIRFEAAASGPALESFDTDLSGFLYTTMCNMRKDLLEKKYMTAPGEAKFLKSPASTQEESSYDAPASDGLTLADQLGCRDTDLERVSSGKDYMLDQLASCFWTDGQKAGFLVRCLKANGTEISELHKALVQNDFSEAVDFLEAACSRRLLHRETAIDLLRCLRKFRNSNLYNLTDSAKKCLRRVWPEI